MSPFCEDILLPVLLSIVGSVEQLLPFRRSPISPWQGRARSERAENVNIKNDSSVKYLLTMGVKLTIDLIFCFTANSLSKTTTSVSRVSSKTFRNVIPIFIDEKWGPRVVERP